MVILKKEGKNYNVLLHFKKLNNVCYKFNNLCQIFIKNYVTIIIIIYIKNNIKINITLYKN